MVVIAVTAVFGAVTLKDMFDLKPAAQSTQEPVVTTTTEPVAPEPTVTTATLESPGRLSGAIFTTYPDGGIVNGNVWYDFKIEVYLDGGPPPNAPVTSAGLPEGLYVFQVTDPSGKVLLSEDPSKCRIVRISEDGVIVELVNASDLVSYDSNLNGYTDTYTVNEQAQGAKGKGPKNLDGTEYPCHVQDEPDGVAGPSGRHDTNVDVDHGSDYDAIVVQLMPFFDTPNPGGVYKAWITPLYEYLNDHNGDLNQTPEVQYSKKGHKKIGYEPDPGFGPPRGDVKTDNFKVYRKHVEEPPVLRVLKFHDINGNGEWEMGDEPEIGLVDGQIVEGHQCVDETGALYDDCNQGGGGWAINITEPPITQLPPYTEYTRVVVEAGEPGDYTIEELSYPNWVQSTVQIDGGAWQKSPPPVNPVTVTVLGDPKEEHEVVFGNYMPAEVHGRKYIDLNGNRDFDAGEECKYAIGTVNEDGCSGIEVHLDGTTNLGLPVNEVTHTDTDGNFSFDGIAPGEYVVTVIDVEAKGYLCSNPESCQIPISLESGDVIGEDVLSFGDLSLAEIHVIKYDDFNGNGTRDPGELGVEGVKITLTGYEGDGDEIEPIELITDNNGMVSFIDLWPGHYHVAEEVPEGRVASTDEVVHVTLTSDNITDVEFGNYIPGNITGMKYIDMNGNGEYDNGDKTCSELRAADPNDPNIPGCEGVAVHLEGVEGDGDPVNLLPVYTDADGKYEFVGLAPGTYNITITDPAGFVCSDPNPCKYLNVPLGSDQSISRDFGDFLPVNISALKYFDINHNGEMDGDEQGIEGVKICLNDSEGIVTENAKHEPIQGCMFTDSDGMVEWIGLAPGDYTIWVDESTLPGSMCATTGTSVSFSLESGETGETTEFEFGNYGPCNGLTPGFWKNYNVGQGGENGGNHYTHEQFEYLLQGTIATNKEEALDILDSSCGDQLLEMVACMEKFMLADQLTKNLSNSGFPRDLQEFPNLFEECLLVNNPDPDGFEPVYTLGEAFEIAEAIRADPFDYNILYIEYIKDVLEGFAKQKGQPACPILP